MNRTALLEAMSTRFRILSARAFLVPSRQSHVGTNRRSPKTALFLLASPLLAATVAGAGSANLYMVDRFDDDLNADDCLQAVPNDCSLRGAIRASNLDSVYSVVVLPDGTYDLTREGADEEAATTGDLDVTFDGLTLMSAPNAHPVIRQQTDDRILDFDPSADSVLLLGPMTLQGGTAVNSGGPEESGGSIYAFRLPSLEVIDVDFIGGSAPDDGGCLDWAASTVTPGALKLQRVTFSGCSVEGRGGALYLETEDSTVTFDRVVVMGSSAANEGGGAYIEGGTTTVVLTDSHFEGNTAGASFTTSGSGGGVYLDGGSTSLLRSTIARNFAGVLASTNGHGGGLAAVNAQVLIRNSTLSQNRTRGTSQEGSDLWLSGGTIGLEFTTVKGHDSNQPAAIAVSSGTLDLFASIIEGECDVLGGSLTTSGLNIEHPLDGALASECNLSPGMGDLFTTSPLLRPLAGYGGPTPSHSHLDGITITFDVASGVCPDTDQRGAPRLGLFCHRGSFEAGVDAPGAWIFADGFESGDVAAWSGTTP
jgi:hypothetical protein